LLSKAQAEEAALNWALAPDEFFNMLDSFKVGDGFNAELGKGYKLPWYTFHFHCIFIA